MAGRSARPTSGLNVRYPDEINLLNQSHIKVYDRLSSYAVALHLSKPPATRQAKKAEQRHTRFQHHILTDTDH